MSAATNGHPSLTISRFARIQVHSSSGRKRAMSKIHAHRFTYDGGVDAQSVAIVSPSLIVVAITLPYLQIV